MSSDVEKWKTCFKNWAQRKLIPRDQKNSSTMKWVQTKIKGDVNTSTMKNDER